MAFVRRKNVKGRTYLYLVENRRVDGKVRQTVLEYLGRDPDDAKRAPAKPGNPKRRMGTEFPSGLVVVRRPSLARRRAEDEPH